MGVSIYYSFKVAKNLKSSGLLNKTISEWNRAFNGSPYESWSWYNPVIVKKKLFGENTYKYEGATGLLLNENSGPEPLIKALSILTKIRNQVGGDEWYVHLDDLEMPWIDNSYSIEI